MRRKTYLRKCKVASCASWLLPPSSTASTRTPSATQPIANPRWVGHNLCVCVCVCVCMCVCVYVCCDWVG